MKSAEESTLSVQSSPYLFVHMASLLILLLNFYVCLCFCYFFPFNNESVQLEGMQKSFITSDRHHAIAP